MNARTSRQIVENDLIADTASIASLQEVAEKPCFAQGASFGGFGRAGLKPVRKFLRGQGSAPSEKVSKSLEWEPAELPILASREITYPQERPPDQICSGATGFCEEGPPNFNDRKGRRPPETVGR